ncbi:MAG TPA: glycosyltransferase family 87 protein [Herpetosiphonaceae bacterium]
MLFSLGLVAVIVVLEMPEGRDFHVYFVAMQSVAHTGDPYAIWPPSEVPYMYPPLLAYLMQPLRKLDLRSALLMWTALNVALSAGILLLATRLSGSVLLRRAWGVAWFILLLSGPGGYLLRTGQVGAIIGILMVGSVACFKKSFPLAALLLAVAINLKLYPALLALPYLLWRTEDMRELVRRLAWLVIWTLGLFCVGWLVWGWPVYQEYIDRFFLQPVYVYPYQSDFNVSINAFFLRLFSVNEYTAPIVAAPRLASALTILANSVVFAACLWCSWVARSRRPELVFSAWIVGMMLISPSNGSYNFVVLALPFACVFARLERRPDPWLRNFALLSGAILALPTAAGVLGVHPWLYYHYGTLVLSAPIYALAGLFALLVRCVAAEREPAAAPQPEMATASVGQLKSAP